VTDPGGPTDLVEFAARAVVEPGEVLQNYRILSLLGRGGMGEVYLAQHCTLGKRVALKALRPELSADPEVLARFFGEAQAVTRIGHEHIVDITHFASGPPVSFYVMELLQGTSVGAEIDARVPWPVRRVLHVAEQIADALAASHAVGVIHRDLKPDNVFLIRRGGDPDYVKVLDFGIAKLTGPERDFGPGRSGRITRSGAVLGTPHYMSPEQGLGRAELDHRSDIYSLGIMLYEMLTLEVPFDGKAFGEILVHHLQTPLPSIRQRRADVPPALEELVLRATAKDVAERFGSMEELRAALLELDPQATAPATRIPAPAPAAAPVRASAALAVTVESGNARDRRPPARRGKASTLIGYGLAAVLAATSAYLAFGRSGREGPPPARVLASSPSPAPVAVPAPAPAPAAVPATAAAAVPASPPPAPPVEADAALSPDAGVAINEPNAEAATARRPAVSRPRGARRRPGSSRPAPAASRRTLDDDGVFSQP
jgi:serine/threonine-protein kinase